MKAFTILLILFFLVIFIANTSVSAVDLTPETPPAAANPGLFTFNQPADTNVIQIQDPATNTTTTQFAQGVVPVTGCTNPYIVQSGDYLGRIAEVCNTTVAAIRLANPSVTNANMIYPGMSLTIPASDAVIEQSAPAGQAGSGVAQAVPTQEVNNTPPLYEQQPTPTVEVPLQVPATGSQPLIAAGTPLEVIAFDFPANTPVSVAVGPQTSGYTVVATGVTDDTGRLIATVLAPNASDPNTPWVVVVATNSTPSIQAMSKPFYIDGVQ